MSRLSALAFVAAMTTVAHAQETPVYPDLDLPKESEPTEQPTETVAQEPPPSEEDKPKPARVAPADMADQAAGASLGIAAGGRTTTGGLRIVGHYLYQLNDRDWFDGTATFTFGSGAPACFRDRDDTRVCDHAATDGASAEAGASVRRFLGGSENFWPYGRLGVGLALVRFSGDDLTGLTVPIRIGGGFRISATDEIAIIVDVAADLGFGIFGRGVGLEPQLGGSLTAGAEFKL